MLSAVTNTTLGIQSQVKIHLKKRRNNYNAHFQSAVMSAPQTLNINAATEKQIKEHLRVGISKARLIIMKHNQQPEKCFTRESFLVEVRQMEGASEWVEGGLISFGPPQTPKSKKPHGVPRRPKKTSTLISEKGQVRTPSTQMSPSLTSPEGEGHGEGETGLLGSGVVGPAIVEGMPQGSIPVPMTPMYTLYQQPQVQPGFGLRGLHFWKENKLEVFTN